MRTRFLRYDQMTSMLTPHLRLLPLAALVLLLAACGGDDDGGGAGASASGSGGTASAEQPAAAAEADTNSASISGTVTFNGDAPEMAVLDMAADPICDEKNKENPRRRQVLVLGDSQTIANVMVQIKSASVPDMDHDMPDMVVEFDQGGCQYAPHVFGLRVGQTLKILNPDGTLHNVHAFSKVNAEFNEAMPQFRTELEKVFDKAEPTPFAVKCDVHPWMNAWAAVFDHPYFAVTGEDGKFTISGLPAGTYEVENLARAAAGADRQRYGRHRREGHRGRGDGGPVKLTRGH